MNLAAARTYAGTRDCKHCGAAFLVRVDQKNDPGRAKYCSVNCSNSARTTRPLTVDDASLLTLYVDQRMTVREVAKAADQNWKRVMARLRELGVIRPPGRAGRGLKRSSSRTYRRVATGTAGRALTASEIVHHIDHDPLNSDPLNLVVVSKQRHSDLHKELEMLSIALYKKGLVTFDPTTGYQMAPRLLALMQEA